LVDSAAKNAPAGSESAVAIMKSSVSAANNALESVQKAVKQATEMAEANFNAVAATAVQRHQASYRRPRSVNCKEATKPCCFWWASLAAKGKP
jgi:cell division ATPase FtsA